MLERTLGVQNMHQIEIYYVNKNDVESNIQRYIIITWERKQPYKNIVLKYLNKRDYSNRNTSVLPLKKLIF